VLYLAVAVLRVYLDQTLQLRWRRWLTDQYVTRWLTDRTFYRMRFSGRVDNPDQRISEDVRLFIERSMALGLGLLNLLAAVSICPKQSVTTSCVRFSAQRFGAPSSRSGWMRRRRSKSHLTKAPSELPMASAPSRSVKSNWN
jgi:hypothetical protein